ncbi:MAG: uncharacterized protein K0Q72_2741 [Armatimonadetes bacterium]|jgi:hypothetical protein|nr:uncharacterized protein [Armatimonadota bacterium]
MLRDFHWSEGEKKIARAAYQAALAREEAALIEETRRRAAEITTIQQVWKLHSYLERQRKAIDAKYDFRYSVIILLFVRLLAEGWLTQDDLVGLNEEKLAAIQLLSGPG